MVLRRTFNVQKVKIETILPVDFFEKYKIVFNEKNDYFKLSKPLYLKMFSLFHQTISI